MKKILLFSALTMFAAGSVYAVSVEFPSYSAVHIGELKTMKSDDYTQTSIAFSGPGLKAFMALLPYAVDTETGETMPSKRMLSITNMGEGVAVDKATAIYIECDNSRAADAPACNITIIVGAMPG